MPGPPTEAFAGDATGGGRGGRCFDDVRELVPDGQYTQNDIAIIVKRERQADVM